jgi:hypothetical protein
VRPRGSKRFVEIPGATARTYRFVARISQTGDLYRAVFSSRRRFVATSAARLEVLPAVRPKVAGPKTASFTIGKPGQVSFGTSGAPSPSMKESGALPAGVSFSVASGRATISGRARHGTEGSYRVTIRARNEAGTATFSFLLRVLEAPRATSPPSAVHRGSQRRRRPDRATAAHPGTSTATRREASR